jgi:hypothetical protein
MANPAFAFLTVTRFDLSGGTPPNPQQIQISYQGVISDGTNQLDFASSFPYDNTLSQTVNLNSAKDALIAAVADLGYTLTRVNIKFNLQMN